MGYTTTFEGSIGIEPPLNEQEISFLRDFNNTRHVDRTRGPLYVGEGRADIINSNKPHPDLPDDFWCQWEPNRDGTAIVWDGGEKFYSAPEWMMYIIFFLLNKTARPYIDAHLDEDPRLASFTCDHVLHGTILAQGEEIGDRWELLVIRNRVLVSNLK